MNLPSDSVLSVSVVILILSISWQIWKFIKSYNKNKPMLPPGPRGLPIVGYLPFLGSNVHVKFHELAQKYGPIYKLWLGNKLYIVISSASIAKEVVRDHDAIFANRVYTQTDFIGSYNAKDVAFSDYGAEWRTSRRIFTRELMSTNTLDATYDVRKDEVRKEIRNVHSKIGSPMDICELSLRVIVNAVLRMTWGDKTGTEYVELVARIAEVMGRPNISDFFPIITKFDIQGVGKEMKHLMQILDRIIEDLIDSTLKNKSETIRNKGSKDFLQMLVQEMMENKDDKMALDKTHMKAILINVIIGGTDTTATTMEWVMAELMNNPKDMENVHKELNEIVGLNNTVEEFHIPNLKYLDAVLKETLRLHPVGPLLNRRTPSESYIVGGFTLPKDSPMLLSLWSIHRDPLVWDNPLKFKPKRFMDNTENLDLNINNFNFFPFGSGRRMCAGMPLANRMVRYALASLLHSFEWKLPVGQKLDMEDNLGNILKKKIPLFLVPIPRLSDPNLYV